jgi:hypothetical protein
VRFFGPYFQGRTRLQFLSKAMPWGIPNEGHRLFIINVVFARSKSRRQPVLRYCL